ncbi:MAG: hypothetical protein EHM47_17530 [Ignavibacteriales bacterium]|nr:MAG: hypothetical protein EHM47_17530 [Ignavibacteriales bacterium]
MKIHIIEGFILLSFFLVTGCGKENGGNKTDTRQKNLQSELIREAGTDIVLLDKNADGKLYQCPMDYQVISDSMATCPVCKMDLEEHDVADAMKNFESHYHK